VLKFKETQDEALHLSRTTTVPQPIKKLSPASDGSLPPAPSIITESGKPHERPLPFVVADDLAQMVIREACSVAELVLTTLDRQVGRR
jgi:hypothetical protein